MSKRHLLIDGDIAIYRAAWSAQHGVDLGDGFVRDHVDLHEARQRIDRDIGKAARAYGADSVHVALSDQGPRWREELMPCYKRDRREGLKPLAFWDLEQYCRDAYGGLSYKGLEADDVLGIWATGRYKKNHVVLTIDKDLRTVPCLLARDFNGGDVRRVTVAEADRTHLLMALTGDRVDGYPGCPGIGPKRAAAILDAADEPWPAIVAAYEKAGLTEGDALKNAQVARILRHGEYDTRSKKVLLWVPPKTTIVEETDARTE